MLWILLSLIFSIQAAHASDPLIDIKKIAPEVVVDLRYATENNFLHRAIYQDASCYLTTAMARRVALAEKIVARDGYHLLLWDCYRSIENQELMWNACLKLHDARHCTGLVANPNAALSYHNVGEAIDVGLADSLGQPIEMPSKFASGLYKTDGFEDKLRARRPGLFIKVKPELWSEMAWKHYQILERALHEAGLKGISTEWWHWIYKPIHA